ncbi:hypothetical protein RUM43_007955 [Polyplax serrata]|uniref:Uncharacterized protein n=1 Tax=Polyplax serrata TaxID=468196 RepID=A0AAN8PY87_POLSC
MGRTTMAEHRPPGKTELINERNPYTAKVSVPKSGTDNTRVRIMLKEKPEERWQPEIIRRENRSATANEGISLWYLRVFAHSPP